MYVYYNQCKYCVCEYAYINENYFGILCNYI